MTKWVLALMASTALFPVAAYAQVDAENGTGDHSTEQLNDIIVTAQRYEQRLQDVPLSVSVAGAKELQARGASDLKDLQYSVPGLSIFELGVGRQQTQLRGISTSIGSSTVGVYLDETPLALDTQGDAFNVRLLDLERVEVLRGPQATLYGQGSMGGTIRYIPAAPRLDALSGSVDGEYSFTRDGASNARAVGVLNLPLSTDTLGLSLVAGYERIGGYIDNVASGAKNTNSADIYTVRANLLARPTDRLTLSLLGLYQESKLASQDLGIDRKTTTPIDQPIRDRYTLIQGKASYDLDFAELSGSASYVDRRNETQFDVSPFFVPLMTLLGFPAGYIDRIGLSATSKYEIKTGEVRLSSQGDGPFGWQVGVAYRDLKLFQFGGDFTAPGTLPFAIAKSEDHTRNKSYALYGEGRYDLTPKLRATVGLRYFHEAKTRTIESTNLGLTTTDLGDDSFHSFNPRLNLSYAFTPDSMVYVNVAKGFRSGGFNQTSAGGGVIPVEPSYKPDSIWTYEAGTKHQLFDRKLILDASVYRTEWSDVQSNNFAPGGIFLIVNNSGHVSGWGVDLSATARPTDALTLGATYGWNNLKFDETTADKAKGDPVDAAIRQSWSASADFRPPLTDSITGIFRVDYQHAGKGQFTLRNLAIPIIKRPARDLVNARIGVAFDQVEVALFANNLFDEDAPIVRGPFSTSVENVEQRPRVIGISAAMKF